MPTARISQILGKFNLKYLALSLVFAAFLILSGVFTGFASEPPNFSKASSSPTTIWSSAKVAPLVTPQAIQAAPLQEADFQVYLPLIIKQSSLRFGPDGLGLLDAILLAPNAAANREVVAALVTLTPPNPTLTPGANTPVPTPLPGTPTFTPTPKLTVTPTASPTATPELIPNGDFEKNDNGWTTFSLRGHRIIFDTHDDKLPVLPVDPTSGSWAVWLGGDDSELSYIQRTIFLPANKPVIAHRYYIHSVDPVCASDLFSDFTVATQFRDGNEKTLNNLQSDVGGLIISDGNTTATYVIDLCARMGTNGWGTIIYDTRFFAGRLVSIQFKTISDSQATSSLFIDDIIIQSDFLGLNPPAPTLNSQDPILFEAPPGSTVVEPDRVIDAKATPAAPNSQKSP